MDYDLEAMAAAAGVKVNKILAIIEPTQSLEDDLYRIIYPVVAAYQQAGVGIASAWVVGNLTLQVVQAIIDTHVSVARAIRDVQVTQVDNWARRVETWHRTRWVGVVKGATRLDISPILNQGDVRAQVEASTQRNVALIKGLSDDMEKKISDAVWTAYADGTTNRQLAKTLVDDLGFAKKRARLIARDQLAKFADSLDGARFAEAGLEFYIWKTVGDDVVRPTHRDNNGKKFRNDTPPPVTGHPGHDINCRCKRRAVIYTDAEEAAMAAA